MKGLIRLTSALCLTALLGIPAAQTASAIADPEADPPQAQETVSSDLSFEDISIPNGYYDYLTVPNDVTFEYDYSKLYLDGTTGYVLPLQENAEVVVTALRGEERTQFTVRSVRAPLIDRFSSDLNEMVEKANGQKGGVLFLGDSFMDERYFFLDFQARYGEYRAQTVGIGSTRATQWYYYGQKFLGAVRPSAIVVHLGTNDMYDASHSAQTTFSNLIRCFEAWRKELPSVRIYWYTVAQRIDYGAWAVRDGEEAVRLNALMTEYAASRDWLTVMDLYGNLTNADGSIKTQYYRDNVHLTQEGYDILCALLAGTDLTMERK